MKIDEIQCIKELRNGSYQAFTQIYEAYADRLYSFVLKQLKNRSLTQDIVQDTFLRLWDNRNQLNSFGNLQAFIFTIAKHQVIDYFRKQVNELQFEDFMEYCENQATDVSRKISYCTTNSCNNFNNRRKFCHNGNTRFMN